MAVLSLNGAWLDAFPPFRALFPRSGRRALRDHLQTA